MVTLNHFIYDTTRNYLGKACAKGLAQFCRIGGEKRVVKHKYEGKFLYISKACMDTLTFTELHQFKSKWEKDQKLVLGR